MDQIDPRAMSAADISLAEAGAWEDEVELLSQRHFLEGVSSWQFVNVVPLFLIAMCSMNLPDWRPTAALIVLHSLCLVAMFSVSRLLRKSDHPPSQHGLWRTYNILAFCWGGLWAGLMQPVAATLGTNISSTFVCVVIIASVAITSMVIAPRWEGFVHFLVGVIGFLLPQTIYYMNVFGPIPMVATVGLAPALWAMAETVRRQERALIRIQLEKEHLTHQLSHALEKAEFLANRDSLTGLYNRRAFEALADDLRQAPENDPICLVLIDLDHFKSINDRLGHATGDSVLQKSAALILESMGPMDVLGRGDGAVARWGGEEFLLLLPNCPLPMAAQIAGQLRARLTKMSDPSWPAELVVSGSFGVACWEAGTGLHHCINNADQAMYRAKQAGRNRVEVNWGESAPVTPPDRIALAG